MESLKRRLTVALALPTALAMSCGTPQLRFSVGALGGGALGAVGGVLLSPADSQNRLINGLVFGLGAGLIGAGLGVFTGPDPGVCAAEVDLKPSGGPRTEYHLDESGSLPDFLKSRLSPTVIEQYQERDRISEDGALHEPHRVYRVKKPADLVTDSHVIKESQQAPAIDRKAD